MYSPTFCFAAGLTMIFIAGASKWMFELASLAAVVEF